MQAESDGYVNTVTDNSSSGARNGGALETGCRCNPMLWLVAVLAGMGSVWSTGPYGVAVSPDSVTYLAAASYFVQGDGWVNAMGMPLTHRPPLFSFLIAGFVWCGVSPALGAGIVNAVAFGLIVLLAGHWLFSRLRSRVVAALGLMAIITYQPLIDMAAWAWTEPLFLLFVLITLMQAERYLIDGTRAALAWAGVAAGLAYLSRYPAISLYPFVGLLVLLRPGKLWRDRLWDAAIFSSVAVLMIFPWSIRTYLISGHLTGTRKPSTVGPWENTVDALRPFLTALRPDAVWSSALSTTATVAIMLVAVLAVMGLWRNRTRLLGGTFLPILPFSAYVMTYVVFLIVVQSLVGAGFGVVPRFIHPVVVPFFMVLAFVLDRALPAASSRFERLHRWGLVGATVVWLVAYPALYAVSFLTYRMQAGAGGYSTREWVTADINEQLAKGVFDGVLLSNRPYIATWFAGRTVHRLVGTGAFESAESRKRARDVLAGYLAEKKPVYLIWINAPSVPGSLSRKQALSHLNLAPFGRVRDGTGWVYQLASPDIRG